MWHYNQAQRSEHNQLHHILPEKLTDDEVVALFSAIYRTRTPITVLTDVHHWPLSPPRRIQPTPYILRIHLVLSCNKRRSLSAVLLLTKTACAFICGPLEALDSLIADAHSSLSTAFCRHLLSLISRRSFSTSSSHLSLGIPFYFPPVYSQIFS